LRPAVDLNFYKVLPGGKGDDPTDDPLEANWYMPESTVPHKEPRASDRVGNVGGSGKRGDSEVAAIWAGPEKDDYAIVKEESTCFDSAELVDASITDSDVSEETLSKSLPIPVPCLPPH